MNKVYRVIWSEHLQCMVAVSEISKAHGKSKSQTDERGGVIENLAVQAASAVLGNKSLGMAMMGMGLATSAQAGWQNVRVDEGTAQVVIDGQTAKYESVMLGATVPYQGNDSDVANNKQAEHATVIGAGAATYANYGTAYGNHAVVMGRNGVAVGVATSAAKDATALGSNTYASGNSSIAIGNAYNEKYRDVISLDDARTLYSSLAHLDDDPDSTKYPEAYSYVGLDGKTYTMSNKKYLDDTFFTSLRQYSPTIAAGEGSIAIGSRAVAYGDGSTAFGTLAYALAEGATAIGLRSHVARGATSGIAMGDSTRVYAANSVAVGNRNEATKQGAVAYGFEAKAAGNLSMALGAHTSANAQMTDESFNAVQNILQNTSLSEAEKITQLKNVNITYQNDTDAGVRHTESLVKPDGTYTTQNIYQLKNIGNDAIALGGYAFAQGDRSVALGVGTLSLGTNSMALGSLARANATNAMAIGVGAEATMLNSVALGTGSKTDYSAESFAKPGYAPNGVGLPSSMEEIGVISVGTQTNLRRIVNAAPGAEDNDVVTVRQLKELQDLTITTINTTIPSTVNLAQKADVSLNNINAAGKKVVTDLVNVQGAGSISVSNATDSTSGTKTFTVGLDSATQTQLNNLTGITSDSSSAANVAGYKPETNTAATNTSSDWLSTKGTLNVGNGGTRRIEGVAAGQDWDDAVNVAQLKNLRDNVRNLVDVAGTDGIEVTTTTGANNSEINTVRLSQATRDTLASVANKANVNLDNLGTVSADGANKIKDAMTKGSITSLTPTKLVVAGGNDAILKDVTIDLSQDVKDSLDKIPTLETAVSGKASTDASNLSAADVTAWQNALGVNTNPTVAGADRDLSNLTIDGKKAIGQAVKVVNSSTGVATVTENVDAAGVTTYTVDVAKGAVAAGDNGVVTGDTVNTAIEAAKTTIAGDIANKANTDASNIDAAKYAEKLGTGAVADNDANLVTGNTVYDALEAAKTTIAGDIATAVSDRAKTDASNIDATAYAAKLGTGAVADNDANLVTGDTVYDALEAAKTTIAGDIATAVSDRAKTDASNIDATAYAAKLGTGAVADNDANLVTGDTVYDALEAAKTTIAGDIATAVSDRAKTDASNIDVSAYTTALNTGAAIVSGNGNLVTGGQVFDALGGYAKNDLSNLGVVSNVGADKIKDAMTKGSITSSSLQVTGGTNAALQNVQIELSSADQANLAQLPTAISNANQAKTDAGNALAAVANKANKDLSDITNTGKATITGLIDVKAASSGEIEVTPTTDPSSGAKTFTVGLSSAAITKLNGLSGAAGGANAADTNLGNITPAGKKVIGEAVKVAGSGSANVLSSVNSTTGITTYTVDVVPTLVLTDASGDEITRVRDGKVYDGAGNELVLANNGQYYKTSDVTANPSGGYDANSGAQPATYTTTNTYRDANNTQLIQAADGKYYQASEVNADGTVKTAAELSYTPTAVTPELRLADADGTTTTPVILNNVKSTVGLNDNSTPVAPITAADAQTAVGTLLTQTTGLNQAATVGDLQALAQAGLDFVGNDSTTIHKALGESLKIEGKSGATYSATDYSADNLATYNDGGVLRIAISQNPTFTSVTAGSDTAGKTVISKDGVSITQAQPATGTAKTATFGIDTAGNATITDASHTTASPIAAMSDLDKKANADATGLSASDITAWQNALGVNTTPTVAGADRDLSNLTVDGKKAIGQAVKVVNSSTGVATVTENVDATTGVTTYTVDVAKGTVAAGDNKVVTGDAVNTAIDAAKTAFAGDIANKANTDASNIDADKYTTALNTGAAVADGNTKLVTGDQVSDALGSYAKTDASNIDAAKYTTALNTGAAIASGNGNLVTGGQVFDALGGYAQNDLSNLGVVNTAGADKIKDAMTKGNITSLTPTKLVVANGNDAILKDVTIDLSQDVKDSLDKIPTLETAVSGKASTDASNLSAADVTAWKTALGVNSSVAGADRDLSNLTVDGKKAIGQAVKVTGDSTGVATVTESVDANGVTTYTVNVAKGTVAAGDDKVVTGDAVNTAIEAAKTALASITTTGSAADGKDGAAGTAGATGLTGQDGLNGKDLTTKVNALRDGEAGAVVFTAADGTRLVKANDGQYYKASEVNPNGTVKTAAENGGIVPTAVTPELRLANADGSTTTPVALNNVKSGLGLSDSATSGVSEAEAKTALTNLLSNNNNGNLNRAANMKDLQALAQAGLDFVGNSGATIHKALGTELKIQGKSNATYSATTYSADNIATYVDSGVLRIAMSKTPTFDGVTVGDATNGTTVISADGVTITPANTTLQPVKLGVDADGKATITDSRGTAPVILATQQGVGTTEDGKDGKDGVTGGTGAAGANGLTGQDGLNGKDLTSKVNALRDGEAGTVVFTAADGTRLVKANDGLYYPADQVNEDGSLKAGAAQETPVLSLANADTTTGSTLTPVILNNVKSTIGLNGTGAAITETAARANVTTLLTQATGLNQAATVGDLQALAVAGLTFAVDDGTTVHKSLGEKLEIVGEHGITTRSDGTKLYISGAGVVGTGTGTGVAGKSLLSGTTAPTSATGNEGDTYINATTGDVYTKTSSGWGTPIGNLKGAKGDTGDTGAAGATGATGATGKSMFSGDGQPSSSVGNAGDTYVDGITGNVYTKQTNGTWQQNTAQNLKGSSMLSGAGVPNDTSTTEGSKNGDTYLNRLTGDVYKKADDGTWALTGQNLKGNDGKSMTAGANAPINATQGTTYVDTATGTVYTKQSDGTWAVNPSTTATSGSGAPTSATTGDTYVDTDTNTVYTQSGGTWTTATNATAGSSTPTAGTSGSTGDTYVDGVTGNVYTKQADGTWTQVTDANLKGSSMLSGSGTPSNTDGKNGDTYVDINTGSVYTKANGTWTDTNKDLGISSGSNINTSGATGAISDSATMTKQDGTPLTPTNSTAIGSNAKLAGDESTIIGSSTTLTGDNATAVGSNIKAVGNSTVAIGQGSIIAADNGTAIGQGATVTADATNAVAIGQGSVADAANTVSVGSVGNERRITNVAPGVLGTDAVNMDQFNAGISGLNSKMDRMDRKLRGGIAGNTALVNIPQVTDAGDNMLGVGVGTFKGESAIAVGYSHMTDSGKIVVKVSGAANSNGDINLGAGVGFRW